jgi:hypothetical protein
MMTVFQKVPQKTNSRLYGTQIMRFLSREWLQHRERAMLFSCNSSLGSLGATFRKIENSRCMLFMLVFSGERKRRESQIYYIIMKYNTAMSEAPHVSTRFTHYPLLLLAARPFDAMALFRHHVESPCPYWPQRWRYPLP